MILKPGSHMSPMIGGPLSVIIHSRRKFTKDFTHEQSLTTDIADVGDLGEPGFTGPLGRIV